MEVLTSVMAVAAETLSIFATGSPSLTSWPFFTRNSVIFTSAGSSMSWPSPASRVPPPRTMVWTEPWAAVASSTLATGPSWVSCCRARAGSIARPITTSASTPHRTYRRICFFFVLSISLPSVVQRVDGLHLGGLIGRVQSEDHADEEAEGHGQHDHACV